MNEEKSEKTNFDDATRSFCRGLDSCCCSGSHSTGCSSVKQAFIVLSNDLTRSSSDNALNDCSPK